MYTMCRRSLLWGLMVGMFIASPITAATMLYWQRDAAAKFDNMGLAEMIGCAPGRDVVTQVKSGLIQVSCMTVEQAKAKP